MKINDAKKYVAGKLGIDVIDLSNEDVMSRIREDLDIGLVCSEPDGSKGMIAKSRIAKLLDIEINSVNKFYAKLNAPFK
jgi:dimethylamine--corrinoid protein Co-methyltransferase